MPAVELVQRSVSHPAEVVFAYTSQIVVNLQFIAILRFSNVRFTPLLVPFFANWNKSEEDFCFHKKDEKQKIAFSVCFAGAVLEAVGTPAAKVAPPSPFPGNYTQYLRMKAP